MWAALRETAAEKGEDDWRGRRTATDRPGNAASVHAWGDGRRGEKPVEEGAIAVTAICRVGNVTYRAWEFANAAATSYWVVPDHSDHTYFYTFILSTTAGYWCKYGI